MTDEELTTPESWRPLLEALAAAIPDFKARDVLIMAFWDDINGQFKAGRGCPHRVADARNERVESGYLCVDCGAVFAAADHDTGPGLGRSMMDGGAAGDVAKHLAPPHTGGA